MKLLLSILMMFCSVSANYPIGTYLSVVTDYTYMYKESSFTSAREEFKIEHGGKVQLEIETPENDFYFVSYSFENVEYKGYVYKECLVSLESEQEVVLTYNAKTSAKTDVYSMDKNQVICTVGEGKELYLYEGFDSKSEYTAVKFSYNGEIMLGYIKTIDISPYGISSTLIIAITAIIACVGVIMILLGINKKKTHKMPIKDKQKND